MAWEDALPLQYLLQPTLTLCCRAQLEMVELVDGPVALHALGVLANEPADLSTFGTGSWQETAFGDANKHRLTLEQCDSEHCSLS